MAPHAPMPGRISRRAGPAWHATRSRLPASQDGCPDLHGCVEADLAADPDPVPGHPLVDRGPHRSRVAGGAHREREDQAHRAVRRDQLARLQQEQRGVVDIAQRAKAEALEELRRTGSVPSGPAAELAPERRVAEDDVEPTSRPIGPGRRTLGERVGAPEVRLGNLHGPSGASPRPVAQGATGRLHRRVVEVGAEELLERRSAPGHRPPGRAPRQRRAGTRLPPRWGRTPWRTGAAPTKARAVSACATAVGV